MNERKVNFILDIVEGIICLIGVIVFSIVGIEVNEVQRFLFIIADFYCAIKLANCFDKVIDYIKSRKNNKVSTQQLDQIMYWS